MAVLKQKSKKLVSNRSRVSKQGKTAKKVTTGKKLAAPLKKSVLTPKKALLPKTKQGVAKEKKPAAAPKRVSPPKKQSLVPSPVVAVVETTRVSLQQKVIPLAPKPSAQTCPLVLDGIILEEDFSPRECFSCDEFDCRFYSAEERSGPLGSRLFVGGEDEEEGDEWGLLDEGGDDPGEADGWGDTDDE
jgi:hypothetical protein